MLKKIFGLLLVLVVLVFSVSSSFAIIKGFESNTQSLIKVGEDVIVPQGAEVISAVSVGGSVTVYGHVLEDVVAVGGSVALKDSAIVEGDVVSVGGMITKDSGVTVKGQVNEVAMAGIAPTVSFFTKGGLLKSIIFFSVLNILGMLGLTVILVAFFTPQLGKLSANLETNLLKNLLIGLLILVLFIPLIIILAISIMGIVFIPVVIMVMVAAWVFGYIAAGHLLGKRTLRAFKIYGKSMMVETLTGVILLLLVGLIPFGGTLIKTIVVLCSLGGIYQTRFGTR